MLYPDKLIRGPATHGCRERSFTVCGECSDTAGRDIARKCTGLAFRLLTRSLKSGIDLIIEDVYPPAVISVRCRTSMASADFPQGALL
jgi:hypothetical protein